MSTALRSQGSIVAISLDDADTTAYASAEFATVNEVTTIPATDGQANDIDVTSLESTAEESLVGLKRFGSLELTMNGIENNAGHDRLIEIEGDEERAWLKITWPSGTVWYYKVNVKSYRWSASVDSKIEATAAFKISGDRTIVSAS